MVNLDKYKWMEGEHFTSYFIYLITNCAKWLFLNFTHSGLLFKIIPLLVETSKMKGRLFIPPLLDME